jgi:hypothetical protein
MDAAAVFGVVIRLVARLVAGGVVQAVAIKVDAIAAYS